MPARARRAAVLAALAAWGLLTAGCSGGAGSLAATAGSGGHTASSPSPPSSTPPAVSHGAPPVQHPIDTTHFRKHPCDFLTSKQVKRLGIPTAATPSFDPQPGCRWANPDTADVTVAVDFIPNGHGLSSLYLLNQEYPDNYVQFESGPIVNGFPTVLARGYHGLRSGDCSYAVGLSDGDAVNIQLHMDTGGDPCHDALQVVKDVTLTAKRSG
jgi:hypothetical protein